MMEKRTKVGVWEYYGRTPRQGQVLVQKYDHTTHKLLYYRPIAETTYNVQFGPDQWKRQLVDQPPLFIGGDAALATYIIRMNYPPQAQAKNVQGKVIVGFSVDTLGHVSNHRVLTRLGSGCDEEALRVARTIPNEWVPARLGKRAVVVEYELPITFRLAQTEAP